MFLKTGKNSVNMLGTTSILRIFLGRTIWKEPPCTWRWRLWLRRWCLYEICNDSDEGGDDRPEQVEVVLSLKAALYGTVIATYTVANNIACTMVMILNNIGWCNGATVNVEIWPGPKGFWSSRSEIKPTEVSLRPPSCTWAEEYRDKQKGTMFYIFREELL